MNSRKLLLILLWLTAVLLLAGCDEYEEWEPDVIWVRPDVYYYAFDQEYRGEGYFLHLTLMDDETRDFTGGATVTIGDVLVPEDTFYVNQSLWYYQYEMDLDSLFAVQDEYMLHVSHPDLGEISTTIRKFELPVVDELITADTLIHDGELSLTLTSVGAFPEVKVSVSSDNYLQPTTLTSPGMVVVNTWPTGNYGWLSIRAELETRGDSYRKPGQPILQVLNREYYRDDVRIFFEGYLP